MSLDAQALERLAEMGLEMPAPPKALASYVPVVVSDGGVAYVAGQVPMVDGQLLFPGAVGADVSIEDAASAAERAALQALSALRGQLGTLDRLVRLLQVNVFVACDGGFTDQPKVANGASELFASLLGDAGRHSRAAVGVASLPLGSCVEVQVTAETRSA